MKNKTRVQTALNAVGDIFVPMIPGAVIAGLCAGFASLLVLICPDYAGSRALTVLYNILNLINVSFLTYMTAWIGYSSAKRFGGTPILGGMLGMITSLDGVNAISQAVGLYNADNPNGSVLCSGRGGVLAAILGVWLMCKVEQFFRAHIRGSMAGIFCPLLTLLVCTTVYVLAIMPLTGFISTALCSVIEFLCMNDLMAVRILAGAVCAFLFLPLVAAGMHMGLAAIYTLQLETTGSITILPALAMAGAGQVGACLAIYTISKNNPHLRSVIRGAVPAGVCGVGQPLIYGVTLPLGKPFITAGLGAMFGGAFVTAMQVSATTWGPSGVLAVFIMTAGPAGAAAGMVNYLLGLLISAVMGFILTRLLMKPADVEGKLMEADEAAAPAAKS